MLRPGSWLRVGGPRLERDGLSAATVRVMGLLARVVPSHWPSGSGGAGRQERLETFPNAKSSFGKMVSQLEILAPGVAVTSETP